MAVYSLSVHHLYTDGLLLTHSFEDNRLAIVVDDISPLDLQEAFRRLYDHREFWIETECSST